MTQAVSQHDGEKLVRLLDSPGIAAEVLAVLADIDGAHLQRRFNGGLAVVAGRGPPSQHSRPFPRNRIKIRFIGQPPYCAQALSR